MQYRNLSLAAIGVGLAASSFALSPGCDDDGPTRHVASAYLGATRVFGPDSSSGYLFSVDSLDASSTVDLSTAIEIDDAWVFGDANPYFFTATIFSPEITQWSIDESGAIVRGPTVSFINEGVGGTYTAAFTAMYAEDKSYFADSTSMQVVVWDPSAMQFVKTIPIPTEDIPGYFPWIYLVVREHDIVANIYFQSDDLVHFQPFVRTVVIDPETDTVVETHDDDRCGSLGIAGLASDGTIYYSAVDYNATIAGVFGEGYGASSCAFRVQPGEGSLDESFTVDLSSLVGGRPAGSAYLVDDDELIFHVWNDWLVDATPENFEDTRFEPGYTWYRWRIGSDTATELPDQLPSTEGGDFATIGGRVYAFRANADYSETSVARFEDDGHFTSGLTVPGWIVKMIAVP